MTDDVDVRVADGVEQAGGDLVAGLAQAAVQRGDDDIQLGQGFIGVIQRAVGADLDLGALQQADGVAQLGLGSVDLRALGLDLVDREPAGDAQAGGVVGDGQDFASRARRAASAISLIERRPSLQVEWECSSAWMSLSWIRSGSLPLRAASTSPRSSRSSGGIQGRPRAA